ncbi:hypothetical protein Ancab_015537 [Ancistrocladus abbreviatus]
MMGRAQASSPPDLYPQELQLKLYQAFIFSIPILFAIILFLLFYLFYLKKRASNPSPPSPAPAAAALPLTSNHSASFLPSPWHLSIKEEVKSKLQVVLFDEELRARDTLCCVCLGEFELREELRQVPSCKHVFHADCIRHWLRANATCPLCRCLVFPTMKVLSSAEPPIRLTDHSSLHRQQHIVSPSHLRRGGGGVLPQLAESSNSNVAANSTRSGEHVLQIEESSSNGETHLRESR